MTELMFLPSVWMDEYVPDPQTDVNLFIFRDDTGTYYLRPVEDQDDAESYSQALNHGDIVMFDEHRQFGDFTLTINEDGSWETDSPIPTDATCIPLTDIEALVARHLPSATAEQEISA